MGLRDTENVLNELGGVAEIIPISSLRPKLADFIRLHKDKSSVLDLADIEKYVVRYEFTAYEKLILMNSFGHPLKDYEYAKLNWLKNNKIYRALQGKEICLEETRIDSAYNFITKLHNNTTKEYFIIFFHKDTDGKAHQYGIKNTELKKGHIRKILTLPNVYVGVNSFYKTERKEEFVGKINVLQADIDNVDIDKYLNDLKSEKYLGEITPLFINRTGRGIQIIIGVLEAYGNRKLNLFAKKIMQEGLMKVLPSMDSNATDLARVLRIPGSTYQKGDKTCIIETVFESDNRYTLDHLGKQYLGVYEPKPDKKKESIDTVKRKIDNTTLLVQTKNGVEAQSSKFKTLEINRLEDLLTLKELGHFDKDRRKRYIYFTSLWSVRTSNDIEYTRKYVYARNSELKKPLTDSELKEVLNSTLVNYHYPKYNYSTKRVLSDLEIPVALQTHLKALRGKEMVEAKKSIAKEKKRQKKVASSKLAKAVAIEKAYNLYHQGYTLKEIATKLEIPYTTARGYIQKYKNQ